MNYTNTEIKHLIDEYLHSERHREIMKRRLIDGLTYAELAEEFNYSTRQMQRIVYKLQNELFKRL